MADEWARAWGLGKGQAGWESGEMGAACCSEEGGRRSAEESKLRSVGSEHCLEWNVSMRLSLVRGVRGCVPYQEGSNDQQQAPAPQLPALGGQRQLGPPRAPAEEESRCCCWLPSYEALHSRASRPQPELRTGEWRRWTARPRDLAEALLCLPCSGTGGCSRCWFAVGTRAAGRQ